MRNTTSPSKPRFVERIKHCLLVMLDCLRAMEEGAYGIHEKRIRDLEVALDSKVGRQACGANSQEGIDNIKATSVPYPTQKDSWK